MDIPNAENNKSSAIDKKTIDKLCVGKDFKKAENNKSQSSLNKDSSSKHSDLKYSSSKDSDLKNSISKDSKLQDLNSKDSKLQDLKLQDSVSKGFKSQDSGSKDSVIKDAKSSDEKKSGRGKVKKKYNLWSIKITIISLFLCAFISFLSELTASSEHMTITIMLLLFLILSSTLFDGIGVAVTSCELSPIMSMAARKIYGAKTAVWLVKNNEKVSNVCNDVIGDIFGIISGACSAAIVAKIIILLGDSWQKWLAIGISSVVAALTIGGKAFLKNFAISNSIEFVMFVARIIAIFSADERRRKKKQTNQRKKYENADEEHNDLSKSTESANSTKLSKPIHPSKQTEFSNQKMTAKASPIQIVDTREDNSTKDIVGHLPNLRKRFKGKQKH